MYSWLTWFNPDYVEAVFVIAGIFTTIKGAQQIFADKQMKGTYWPTWLVYTLYEFWRVPYYLYFHQWYSLAAGIILTICNVIAVYGIFKYCIYFDSAKKRFVLRE